MDKGSIVQFDKPEDIYNKPKNRQVADYFSKPNYIDGYVSSGFFKSDILKFPCELEEGDYTAVIRESAIKLNTDKDDYIIKDIIFTGAYKEFIIGIEKKYIRVSVPECDEVFHLKKGDRLGIEIGKEAVVYFKRQ